MIWIAAIHIGDSSKSGINAKMRVISYLTGQSTATVINSDNDILRTAVNRSSTRSTGGLISARRIVRPIQSSTGGGWRQYIYARQQIIVCTLAWHEMGQQSQWLAHTMGLLWLGREDTIDIRRNPVVRMCTGQNFKEYTSDPVYATVTWHDSAAAGPGVHLLLQEPRQMCVRVVTIQLQGK